MFLRPTLSETDAQHQQTPVTSSMWPIIAFSPQLSLRNKENFYVSDTWWTEISTVRNNTIEKIIITAEIGNWKSV